ncbi:MAG: SDR family oxidoreductase [Deltaproteobacteria bacterium]|jgi:NAD(P)-dependent dehydrogenase (short-subunit alcohol dehydrogenase family)|nr:SDR family oxidoreductase [Deltaproteobacteria bacterium]
MSNKFQDKIIVVTGAASGIGAAICDRFAREGARIVLLDMDEAGVKAAAGKLRDGGVDAEGYGCDVAREEECKAVIELVIEQRGGIDVLVNNAGITQRSAFVDTDISVYRKVMAVNFFGSLHCTKAAIGSLIARQGMIIVIESLAGVSPLLGRTGYCASKHALHGLFTSLRSELRDSGVHIMLVCPGFVATNLQTGALGGDGRVTTHPQSMVGKPTSPARVAEDIVNGARSKKPLLVLTPVGKLSYWVSRLAPTIYERIMARQLREELIR